MSTPEDTTIPSNPQGSDAQDVRSPMTPRSIVWDRFTNYEDEDKEINSKCNYCDKPCKKNSLLEDQISGLPEEILLHICSFLSLKEAIGTSFLSRRWRYLWKFLPRLHFLEKIRQRDAYKRMVNQVLRLYKAPILHEFSIHFPFRQDSSTHIDLWLAFAIAKGVSRLELNFYIPGDTASSSNNFYPIPYGLFDESTSWGMEPHFNLQSHHDIILSLPTSFLISTARNRLKSLTQLFLRSVNLTDQLFENILSNCSSLERLFLHDSRKLVSAKYTGHDQLKLKFLEIYYCKILVTVQVNAPNLVDFKYQGDKIHICIKDAQQLVNLSIISFRMAAHRVLAYPTREYFVFGQFSAYISQLEYLMLDVRSFMETTAFHKVPPFRSLKQLSLNDMDFRPLWVWYRAAISLINASPFLHRLELHLPIGHIQRTQEEETKIIMSPHQNLKEVLVSGFADDDHIEFITSVLDKAIALQKIEMTRSWMIWFAGDGKFLRPKEVADADYNRSPCQLLSKLPPNVQLNIF